MLHFLSPTWFFALTALAMPIFIHLLHRHQGKKIRIGSLQFLQASQSNRFRRFKPHELILLMLRVALVTALVLLLAQPVIEKQPSRAAPPTGGWALVSPEILFGDLSAPTRMVLDSLRVAGYALHVMADGLPVYHAGGAYRREDASPDVWSLLREVDGQLPARTPIAVLAPPRVALLKGQRPALRRPVHWFPVTGLDRNAWLAAARMLGSDSLQIDFAESDSTVMVSKKRSAPVPTMEQILAIHDLPPMVFAPASAGHPATLRLLTNEASAAADAVPVIPAADTLRVCLYFDADRTEDARYVHAAVAAAAEFGGLPVTLTLSPVATGTACANNADLLFWLSALPVPAATSSAAPGQIVVRDAGNEKYITLPGKIIMAENMAFGAPAIFRRVPLRRTEAGATIWRDSFGTPLLELTKDRERTVYTFASRFHPAWTDLVFDAAFPQWIFALLQDRAHLSPPDDETWRGRDRRLVSVRQALPAVESLGPPSPEAVPTHSSRPIELPLWIFAAVLFLGERLFSEWTVK